MMNETFLCNFESPWLYFVFLFSALRSHGKSATFRQHYYPEGGWGWVITFCSFLVNIFTTGLQLSFSVLYLEILDHCASELPEKEKQSSSVGKSTKLKHFQSLSIKQSISGGCQRSEIKKTGGTWKTASLVCPRRPIKYRRAKESCIFPKNFWLDALEAAKASVVAFFAAASKTFAKFLTVKNELHWIISITPACTVFLKS